MPIIEIGADTRGLTTSLAQADKALDQTAKKADRAEKEVKEMGRSSQQAGANMSAAFAATGGGLAITHGLEGMASGFRSGNSAMAAFAAAQALLDLGRFKEDMRGVTDATGNATSVFGKLGAIMKAHPLMTIATVLATAASAMAIFGSDTDEATESVDELGKKIKELEAAASARLFLTRGRESGAGARVSAIERGVEQLMLEPDRSTVRLGELARMSAVPQAELLRVGRQIGAPMTVFEDTAQTQMSRTVAESILREVYDNMRQLLLRERTAAAQGMDVLFTRGVTGMPEFRGYGAQPGAYDVPLPPQRPVAPSLGLTGMFLGMGLEQMQAMQEYAAGRGTDILGRHRYRPGLQYLGMGGAMRFARESIGQAIATPRNQPDGQVFSPAMAEQAAMIQQQQDQAKANMDELIAQGQQFGMVIGDAFFRVAEGTMTAKQALAELVRMFAQMAAQQAFAGIGGAVAQSFAPTQAQTTANATPPAPGAGVGP